MVNSQNIIKVKPRYIFFITGFVVLGFVVLVQVNIKQVNKHLELNSYMNIDSVMITGNEKYGALRGAVFIKKGCFISTNAKLIENRYGFNSWESNGPIIDLNNESHKYTLDDLGLPYIVYKEADSDTLHIIKNGFVLKFLLQ